MLTETERGLAFYFRFYLFRNFFFHKLITVFMVFILGFNPLLLNLFLHNHLFWHWSSAEIVVRLS